jgi:hypothetical protein
MQQPYILGGPICKPLPPCTPHTAPALHHTTLPATTPGDEFTLGDVAVGSYLLYLTVFFPDMFPIKQQNVWAYMQVRCTCNRMGGLVVVLGPCLSRRSRQQGTGRGAAWRSELTACNCKGGCAAGLSQAVTSSLLLYGPNHAQRLAAREACPATFKQSMAALVERIGGSSGGSGGLGGLFSKIVGGQ